MSDPSMGVPVLQDHGPVGPHPSNVHRVNGFVPWKDFVRQNFPWLEHRNHASGEFRARVSAYRVGAGCLTLIQAGASEVIRTRHLAEASEAGYLKLLWQISGEIRIEQDQRDALIRGGQATICDTARPYRIVLSDMAHFAVLTLPYTACAGWEHISQKLCGTRLDEGPGLRASLGALMGLTSLPHDPTDTANDTVVQAVQLMLSTALHRAATEQGVLCFDSRKMSCAQRFVAANVGDADLDANDLASALCMSRRSLYLMFKQHGTTPTKMIANIRLDRCRQMLDDPAEARRKITDIAFESGFGDYATFSRLFKSRFGIAPSTYRQRI